MTNHLFELAGNRKTETVIPKSKKKWYKGKPVVSAAILILIVLGCLCAELIMTKDPTYMDLLNYNKAPDREFLFGTDTMGRDIFFHDLVWRKDLDPDWWISHCYFYFYCSGSRRLQWCGTWVAG